MQQVEQTKKTKKSPVDKKKITKLIARISILVLFAVAIIVGSFFSADNFRYQYKTGIAYSGGYQVQVDVYDHSVTNPDPNTPNGNSEKGLELLKAKLDPLNNSNLYLQTLGKHSVEVMIGKNNFTNFNDLINNIQRLGAIYLTDSTGKDLLVKDNERTPLSDVISGSTTGVDQARNPVITLQIKDQVKWNEIINSLTPEQGNAQPLYIWTDIGQFIDDLRHDTDNIEIIRTAFNQLSLAADNNVLKIFNFEYYDAGTSSTKRDNLLTTSLFGAQLVEVMKSEKFTFQDVKHNDLIIDPNDKAAISNIYLDPIRPKLKQIIDYSKKLTDKYKKYLINWDSINKGVGAGANSNTIQTTTATEAKQISNLINGGLSGYAFVISGYREIDPVVSQPIFIISMVILGVLTLAIFVYLIVYYRLFGFIGVLTLAFTIILTLYFSSLLGVQISPESISALIIAFGIGLEGNILFYSRYKRERYENGVPYEPAVKIANKQTIALFVDAVVVLIILGLSLFWVGTNNIKSFATILLVNLIIAMVMVFAVARLLYWVVIKLRWQEKFKWLDIPQYSFNKLILKKKKNGYSYHSDDKLLATATATATVVGSETPAKSDVVGTETPINDSLKKSKKPKKLTARFYHFSKWTPIAGLILVIAAIIIALTGAANFDSSIKKGTEITIGSEYWQDHENEEKAKADLANHLDTIIREHKIKTKFTYNLYTIKRLNDTKVLVVSTNITGSNYARALLASIASYYGASAEDSGINMYQTNPIMEVKALIITLISFAIGILCIFVYTLFRLDWAQFVGIVLGSLFALSITVSIAIIFQILITFEMLVAFIAIFGFAMAIGTIIMARAKQNKRTVNNVEYEKFFNYMSKHHNAVKKLRNEPKQYVKAEIKALRLANPELKRGEFKETFKAQIKAIKTQAAEIKKKNKKEIKVINKEFHQYDLANNFLQKIANITIKQMFKHCLTLLIILGSLLLVLAAFSGSLFGFNLVIFLGIFFGMFATLLIGIPIWVSLEKYRALNKIRVKNYLDSQRVEIDEQIVIGIND
ncbi:bifunctional preprotein translocase subunit SecD/SecF [Spiroplasma syrphidicola EA-1]|uniref:Bifunctional preprotein translocase subunit SecD/SecF n=1 Tax=Spiroplasma syrphidicola EA-1 TaxID=1276229 RepID=R4U424_9MOLU|nr:protein translocase SecDF, variant type [Spiroplasma syrphidicola]AGM26182.1 bifunctional preprotein translocase subunit SecD/SecF [Spiroplasma syrphidicola EA-1]